MKRLFIAVVLLACAAAVRADDLTGLLGVGGSFGASIPSGSKWVRDNNKNGIGSGAWVRYGLNEHWGAGLSYDNLALNGPSRIEAVMASASYSLDPESIWNPYVRGGIGADFVGNVETGKPSLFGFTTGFGFERFVADDISVGGAFDWFDADKTAGLHDVNAVRVGLTVGLWFGQRNAPRPTASVPSPRAEAPAPVAPPQSVSITLDIEFDTAKSTVKPQYDDQLKKVAAFLGSHTFSTVEIEGHTDNVGAAQYNKDLSQRRAEAVRQALIDRFGIDGDRLTAKGYGPEKPIAGNDTEDGRAKNRRVVATFTGLAE